MSSDLPRKPGAHLYIDQRRVRGHKGDPRQPGRLGGLDEVGAPGRSHRNGLYQEGLCAHPAHANEFFQANSPFARARDGRVDVEPHSVLQLGPTIFQVEWTETQRDRAGRAVGTSDWVATIQVGIVPPNNEDTEKVNPLGIYIESFDWRRRVASLSGGRIFA